MANLRTIKKEINYLTSEIVSNCYLAVYFQGEESAEALSAIISKAVDMNNTLRDRANHPAEKHNTKLVRKHYAAIYADLLSTSDELFQEISAVCSK